MEIKIQLPDEHAAEILAANAQVYKAKVMQALAQRQQSGDSIQGTDQEIVESMLKAQLVSVTSAQRAQKARKDFEKLMTDGDNN